MLRLKPSELTLAPEDVDETWYRMPQRQYARSSAATSERRARYSGHPPVPRLMPGAQRSVSDTITDLDNPALRVQPQQAVLAHVDDDSENSDELLHELPNHVGSSPDRSALADRPTQPANTSPTTVVGPAGHSTRLTLRLEHPRRRSEADQETATSVPGQIGSPERSPQIRPVGPAHTAIPATPRRSRPIDDSFGDSSSTLLESIPSEAPANLRGGAECHRASIRSLGREVRPIASSSYQTRMYIPSRQPNIGPDSSNREPNVRYLRGYFDDGTDDYTFEEVVPVAPSTEPAQRGDQRQTRQRSYSSCDAPPPRLFASDATAQQLCHSGDFWTAVAPASDQPATTVGARPRQSSSEVSNASLAYSVYQLSESRQSSGEQPAQYPLSRSQNDGPASSRHDSRGTYHSVRMSDAHALADNVKQSSTPLIASNEATISVPLPHSDASSLANLHTRISASSVGADSQLITQSSTSQRTQSLHDSSTISAITINHDSPLDALAAHTARQSQRLENYQAYTQRGAQFRNAHPTFYSPGNTRVSPNFPQSAYGSPPNTLGLSGGAFNQPMAMADDPYTRGVSANTGHPFGMITHPRSTQATQATSHANRPYPRSSQSVRRTQRSSENAPVGSAAQSGPPSRTSQVREQVSAFEQMQNAARPR